MQMHMHRRSSIRDLHRHTNNRSWDCKRHSHRNLDRNSDRYVARHTDGNTDRDRDGNPYRYTHRNRHWIGHKHFDRDADFVRYRNWIWNGRPRYRIGHRIGNRVGHRVPNRIRYWDGHRVRHKHLVRDHHWRPRHGVWHWNWMWDRIRHRIWDRHWNRLRHRHRHRMWYWHRERHWCWRRDGDSWGVRELRRCRSWHV